MAGRDVLTELTCDANPSGLVSDGTIAGGMIPQDTNRAFDAIDCGGVRGSRHSGTGSPERLLA